MWVGRMVKLSEWVSFPALAGAVGTSENLTDGRYVTLREQQISPYRHVSPAVCDFKITRVFSQFGFLDLTGSKFS